MIGGSEWLKSQMKPSLKAQSGIALFDRVYDSGDNRCLHVTGARVPKLDNSYLIQMKDCNDCNSLMQMTTAWVLKEKTALQLNRWCNKKKKITQRTD